MALEFEVLLLNACAPAHLADAIIGDLCERHGALAEKRGEARARAICRGEVLRSLPALATYRAAQSFADNWVFALAIAALICGLCIAAIPFWNHLGMAGGWPHVLRLFAIGAMLGYIRRGWALSYAALLLFIGVADAVIDARQFGTGWHVLAHSDLYHGLFIDAVSMAAGLIALSAATFVQGRVRSV